MEILVINAGSSSVKFSLFDFESLRPIARGLLDWAGDARRGDAQVSPSRNEDPTHFPQRDVRVLWVIWPE